MGIWGRYCHTTERDLSNAECKVYTAQQLRSKQNQELVDICRGSSLPVSGKKEMLVQRILKVQEAKHSR